MARAYTDPILFGAAYYDEYIPRDLDRIDTDMEMMTRAGINVIRIGESTWSTCEPQPGHFDWTHIDRALDAATNAGINVIVGTPTYAVPTWLVAMYPDVLATTPAGEPHYGARQIMNIVNPAYRLYGERVIRSLISHVAQQPCVIGYQVDNETKYYDSVSHDMQVMFIKQLRHEFKNDLEALNEAYGLDYWSNRINAWEDFPDLTGSINESLRARFDRFRRDQVAEYLAWQASIIREYMRDDQFITHNFDYEWRGHSYGLQPAVDHFRAARALDICGVDIYHPSEDALTGKEIAFGGDMARSAGGGNYLVLETQAQGQHGWLPYPGQLRLQAYSHLASGADGIMYWHWHSIHNSFETYWRGLLSHDFESNPTYEEAGRFGREIGDPRIGDTLSHLSKRNAVAILASNESLTALSWFHIETGFPMGGTLTYNDVLRSIYDALFELNVEVDFLPADASADQLAGYSLVIAPALYTTDQQTIDRLARYVKNGGHLLATMRSFVADENVKVWHDKAPHHLVDIFGMTYNQFTRPMGVSLKCPDTLADLAGASANDFIEMLSPAPETHVLAWYDHYAWDSYAAITRHAFGSGDAQWVGTQLQADAWRTVLAEALSNAGVHTPGMELAGTVCVRIGTNTAGDTVTYLLNYSGSPITFRAPASGTFLLGHPTDDGEQAVTAETPVTVGDAVTLPRWGVDIIVGRQPTMN